MTKLRLRRTGQPPLVFDGEVLSHASGRLDMPSGRERSRWHEVTIYRKVAADTHPYVVKIAYHSTWPGESPHELVGELATAAGVGLLLRSFDCTGYVKGFPPTAEFVERQAELLAIIRADFAQLVGAVLDLDEFGEEV